VLSSKDPAATIRYAKHIDVCMREHIARARWLRREYRMYRSFLKQLSENLPRSSARYIEIAAFLKRKG
jgi:hypothetical protein